MIKNKKAQISDTLTWVVATIIIVVILLIFIFVSSILAKAKDVSDDVGSKVVGGYEKQANWIKTKTELAYAKKSDNKEVINEWIWETERDYDVAG